MSLVLLRRWVWRCAPTVASGHVIQVAWMDPLKYEASEASFDDPDLKRVVVSSAQEQILEVHCQGGGDIDTLVEAFRSDDLATRLHGLAENFLQKVELRANEKRLGRQPMGFR